MMRINRNTFIILLTLLVFGLSIKNNAQFGSSGTVDARSIGMAKTYNAFSSGIYSVGINPANLNLMNEGSVELSTIIPLPFISFHSGTDFFTINQFNYYFGGVDGKARTLTSEDKQNLSNLFSSGGFLFSNLSTALLSFAWKPSNEAGTFAFSMNDLIGANASIPEAIIDLGLYGNQSGKQYNFNDEDFKSWWIRTYALSYSRAFEFGSNNSLKNINAGITLKLVHGFYYAGIENVNTNLSTGKFNEIQGSSEMIGYSAFSESFGVKYDFDSLDHESNIGLFMPPAGKGIGLDFGLTFNFENNFRISTSLTGLGSMNWTKNAAKFFTEGSIYIDDLTNQDQLDSLKEKFTGDSQPISSFSTGLPTVFRLGFGYELNAENNFLPGTLLLGLDYNQGFNDLPGNSKTPRVSFGFEWKPGDWVPYIRSGISVGGADNFAWAFGLGMYTSIIEFNFATSYFQSVIVPSSAKQISFAFDSKWKF